MAAIGREEVATDEHGWVQMPVFSSTRLSPGEKIGMDD